MFHTILVALDGTPEAATSLPLAMTLARGGAATLLLVQVCDEARDGAPALAAARDYLATFAAGLAAEGLRVETEVRHGDAAGQLVAAARQRGADLILLTTHGRHGLARAWYGSVTAAVVATSPAPVLVLRAADAPPRDLRTLLVPLDETPGSAAALAIAREVALVPGATLVLLRVVPPLPRWGEGWDISPTWEETMRRGAQNALDAIVRDLLRHGIVARGRVVIGPVAATITATAAEVGADLIVMGTRAEVGLRRALFGSVADAVVRTAAPPVLLVRQAGATVADPGVVAAGTAAPRPDDSPAGR